MTLPNFIIYGNLEESDTLEKINELSITGCSDSFRALGLFFLQCSIEMNSSKNWEHSHFLYSGLIKRKNNDLDIICIMDKNGETRKKVQPKKPLKT